MTETASAEGQPLKTLTTKNIEASKSNMNNPILASFVPKLLLYPGLDSGLRTALRAGPHIELIDNPASNLCQAIVMRHQVLPAVNSGAFVKERAL